MRILEEFWYGNIEPTEYDTSSNKEYKKLVELICRNEEKLRAIMTDEQKDLFEKYSDCVRENQVITDCLIFQNGFKLGARMMLEVMKNKNHKQYDATRGRNPSGGIFASIKMQKIFSDCPKSVSLVVIIVKRI